MKAKEITGEELDIKVQDINTDVKVELNLNALALTEGIVSIVLFNTQILFSKAEFLPRHCLCL